MDKKLVFLFPGQGSQYVGMLKDLCREYSPAREVFDQAESLLGMDLKKTAGEGPPELLNQDLRAQLTMFTANAAAYEALSALGLKPAALCGYSSGFYSALYAAGCCDLATGIHLVKSAGELMLELSSTRPGTMGVVIGFLKEEVEAICQEVGAYCNTPLQNNFVTVSNLNAARQLLVSGDEGAVAAVLKSALEKGALGVQPLPVKAAYHTLLMEPAARRFAEEIKALEISAPQIPLLNFTTVNYIKDAEEVRWLLWNEIMKPVRWRECVQRLSQEGYTHYMECGPGEALSKMIRWIDRKAVVYRVDDLPAIRELAEGSRQ